MRENSKTFEHIWKKFWIENFDIMIKIIIKKKERTISNSRWSIDVIVGHHGIRFHSFRLYRIAQSICR